MTRVLAALLAALSLSPVAAAAAPKRANLGAMAHAMVKAGAPAALVYVRTPTAARAGVAGYADRSTHTPMRVADRWRIASLTKAFVSTVVLQLEAEGKLDIDDPVEKFLPGVVPNGSAITLRELMNHTSGLFNYTDAFVDDPIADFTRTWSPSELLALAFTHPPNFAPGTNWSYSNTNYIVLGLVVEAVTGKALGEQLQDRIFAPLGLASTSFPLTIDLAPDFVHGYLKLPGAPLLDVSPALGPSSGWAAGGIVSNARDVTLFYRGLLTGKLLPAAQLHEMETPSQVAGTYGLGIFSVLPACGRAFNHNGDFLAWRTIVYSTANGKRQAVVMINVNDAYVDWGRLDSLAQKALCRG
jgi:D-alanyl-D-alanine carboxypeptidase